MKVEIKELSESTESAIAHSRCCVQFLKTGSTRWVFLIGKFAFKIPSFFSWKNFLLGLLANMQEVNFSKILCMKEKLCPIKFHIPLGFLVVMPRVRVLQENELSKTELDLFCICNEHYKIPAELKADSFGYLKGKLVAIDYGS